MGGYSFCACRAIFFLDELYGYGDVIVAGGDRRVYETFKVKFL
ncbi:MAG: hypothetical protein WBB82_10945 [Limnothrix sp.]